MVDERTVQEARPTQHKWFSPFVRFLRDPICQGISVIIAITAIIIPLLADRPDTKDTSTTTVSISTWTPTPTPTPGVQVAIEIDWQDAGDGFCREVDGNSYHIITVLDAAGDILPPDTFSYKWRFNPPDAYNEEKLGENFRCNAIVYYASPGLNSQTITVEVLKEKKIVAVRSICFNIAGPP